MLDEIGVDEQLDEDGNKIINHMQSRCTAQGGLHSNIGSGLPNLMQRVVYIAPKKKKLSRFSHRL